MEKMEETVHKMKRVLDTKDQHALKLVQSCTWFNTEFKETTFLKSSSNILMCGIQMTESIIPSPIGNVRAKDLKFEIVKEDWNIYKLEDGTTLRIKIAAGKISRGIDPKTEQILYTPEGEPYYNIKYQTVIIADVPKNLLKP